MSTYEPPSGKKNAVKKRVSGFPHGALRRFASRHAPQRVPPCPYYELDLGEGKWLCKLEPRYRGEGEGPGCAWAWAQAKNTGQRREDRADVVNEHGAARLDIQTLFIFLLLPTSPATSRWPPTTSTPSPPLLIPIPGTYLLLPARRHLRPYPGRWLPCRRPHRGPPTPATPSPPFLIPIPATSFSLPATTSDPALAAGDLTAGRPPPFLDLLFPF